MSREPSADDGPKKLSKHKGLNWDKSTGKWLARIIVDGKQKYFGRFADEEVAAKALADAAKNGLTSAPKVPKVKKVPKKPKAPAVPKA